MHCANADVVYEPGSAQGFKPLKASFSIIMACLQDLTNRTKDSVHLSDFSMDGRLSHSISCPNMAVNS